MHEKLDIATPLLVKHVLHIVDLKVEDEPPLSQTAVYDCFSLFTGGGSYGRRIIDRDDRELDWYFRLGAWSIYDAIRALSDLHELGGFQVGSDYSRVCLS